MKWRGIIILFILLFLFIASPITLISIQGDSMEPTIPDNSLLVNYETKNVDDGDIITFYDPQTQQFITHRVVNETDAGYITLGDNNDVIDQTTGIQPVQPTAIEGRAIVVGSTPLYIPYLGSVFDVLQQNLIQVFLIIFGAYLALSQASRQTEQQRVFGHLVARDIFRPIFIVCLVMMVFAFTLTATTLSAPIVYTNSDSAAQQQYVVTTGDTKQIETITIERETTWYLGDLYFSDNLEIVSIERMSDSQVSLRVVVPPEPAPGTLQSTITLYQYPRVLPEGFVQSLATINPVLASFVTSLVTLSPMFLIYYFIIGPTTPIKSVRIEEWLESLD